MCEGTYVLYLHSADKKLQASASQDKQWLQLVSQLEEHNSYIPIYTSISHIHMYVHIAYQLCGQHSAHKSQVIHTYNDDMGNSDKLCLSTMHQCLPLY